MAAVLEVILRGRDELSGTVGKATVSLGSLLKTGASLAVGFASVEGAMYGVKNVMGKSIGGAMKYEAQLAQIRALTGATKQDTDLLDGAIHDMAKTMPKSPAELGAGAYFILSSGITDASDAAEVLEIAARASTVGLGETQVVADALTTILKGYESTGMTAARATDVLMQAVKDGKAEASSFAGVLGRVVPIASQMGISFEEVAANMATFTRLGVSAEEAATGLRGVMSQLLLPSEKAQAKLAEIGITFRELREQIREEGLAASLQMLMERFQGNEEAIATLFPDVRGLTNVLATAGVQLDDYNEILGNMATATGNLDRGFKEVSDTAQFKTRMAMQELNLTLEELGTETLPAVAAGAEAAAYTIGAVTDSMAALASGVIYAGESFVWAGEGLGGLVGISGEGKDSTEDLAEAWKAANAQLAEALAPILAVETAMVKAIKAEREQVGSLAGLADSLKTANQHLVDELALLDFITGQRTREAVAIDLQSNALEQQRASLLQSAPAYEASISALARETSVLQLSKAAIDAEIVARDRLAASTLEQARLANLPLMIKEKELELERAKILDTVGGNTEALTDAQKARVDAIEDELRAQRGSIDVKTLEAELTNLQREASDDYGRALKDQAAAIEGEIGASQRHRDELNLAQAAYDEQIKAIDTQIERQGLELQAIDLVTEAWKLQGQAMLELPTLATIETQLSAFRKALLLQAQQEMFAAIRGFDLGRIGELTRYIAGISAASMQHGGYVPAGVVTPAVLHGPEWVIPASHMGGPGGGVTVNLNMNSKYPPDRFAMQAEAREIMTEMERQRRRRF